MVRGRAGWRGRRWEYQPGQRHFGVNASVGGCLSRRRGDEWGRARAPGLRAEDVAQRTQERSCAWRLEVG